jgi:UDP-hydrolysing UDP-N-acetyl-D-glucosamine 2-epimerase
MLLERFGQAETIVIQDGFSINARVYLEVEGSIPTTMAKSIGLGIIEFSSEFQRLKPDIVLLIGDRYEALSAAVAAAYMNLPLAHIQGGEVSGSIDESARHAISKLAHLHFPATRRAADFLVRMGERPDCVFNVGCPSGDYILGLDAKLPSDAFFQLGSGGAVDPSKPFLLVIFHPVTTHFGTERYQTDQLIEALHELAFPTLWLWPNVDAGADEISKALRQFREHHRPNWLQLAKNLEPLIFQKTLRSASCAIGNSSSFIRDSTFSGTPIVLVGDRQVGREHGSNLVEAAPRKKDILAAIRGQLAHGRHAPDALYGDGSASARIVEHLKTFEPYTQKRLHYVFEDFRRDRLSTVSR